MSDQNDETPAEDNAANLATGMIVVTGVMLLVAIYTILVLLRDHYGEGMLA